MNCPYCDNPVTMSLYIICPVCRYAWEPLSFQIALEAKARKEAQDEPA
uniref:Uncharacterized protein n=2 Tax=viral metagenome TaxID=1070528 RepID=A0A6M3KB84_9ZZZZ